MGERALEAQHKSLDPPKLLSDALYFNKFDERGKPAYQVVKPAEDEEENQEDKEDEEDNIDNGSYSKDYAPDEDDDEAIKKWKAKMRREEKAEAEKKKK